MLNSPQALLPPGYLAGVLADARTDAIPDLEPVEVGLRHLYVVLETMSDSLRNLETRLRHTAVESDGILASGALQELDSIAMRINEMRMEVLGLLDRIEGPSLRLRRMKASRRAKVEDL